MALEAVINGDRKGAFYLLQQEKKMQREILREKTAKLPEGYIKKASADIVKRVENLRCWQESQNVFLYISTKTEPGTGKLVTQALSDGKKVYAPYCFGKGRMDALQITSLDDVAIGKYGVPQPKIGAPLILPNQLSLVIVPCVAADKNGYRLGHGGGYYDRYLPNVACPTVCLCFDDLLQDSILRDEWDYPVDWVVTEKIEIKTSK